MQMYRIKDIFKKCSSDYHFCYLVYVLNKFIAYLLLYSKFNWMGITSENFLFYHGLNETNINLHLLIDKNMFIFMTA